MEIVKRISCVLILITLVVPMLALVPTPITRPAGPFSSQTGVSDSLPAQFVQETLRVAVYAESNVTLPAYASGGVFTSNYAAIAALLASAGYDVTELTTQDILNQQLKTKSFDVFVLPDQLPRESVTNLVKEFWLGGGGILSLHSSIGYLYYHGMIVPGDEGNFALLGVNSPAYWAYDYVVNVTVSERNPVTKDFQVGDDITVNETTVILNRDDLYTLIGDDYGDLLYETVGPLNALAFSIDNGARQGGRIVQLAGNYTTVPGWFSSVVVEAVDWLAPRPKARVLYDMIHVPYLALDPWDLYSEPYFLDSWRNGLVNHSYTIDKLNGTLNLNALSGYDMFVISLPLANFTAQEAQDISTWVNNGGGLFIIGDNPALGPCNAYLNYLLSPFDIKLNLTGATPLDTIATPEGVHPTHEWASTMEYDSSGYLNITGDAFPLWMSGTNVLCAGQEYGEGRVIVLGDANSCADGLAIMQEDNYQFLMNVASWLSSATADVLLLNDEFLDEDLYRVAPALALNSLGINYYITHSPFYLNLSLYEYWDQWDLVIVDEPGMTIGATYLDEIDEWVDAGGKLIMSYYWMHNIADHPLWSSLGVFPVAGSLDEPDIHIWDTGHPIFNLPADYGESLFEVTVDYGTEGSLLHVFSNATSLAGYTVSEEVNQTTIALRDDLQTLCNGFLIDEFQGDYDDSTYMDSFELWVNEIAFMYFERPTIDSPADVTYTVGDTGNEIVWTPNAPAGPWRYILRVNGSVEVSNTWNGAPIAVDVDGVNVSVTTYQMTVFDALGYSVSDTVLLNVTAYAPPPPLDPMVLIAIGIGAVVVIAIIVILSKRGKK